MTYCLRQWIDSNSTNFCHAHICNSSQLPVLQVLDLFSVIKASVALHSMFFNRLDMAIFFEGFLAIWNSSLFCPHRRWRTLRLISKFLWHCLFGVGVILVGLHCLWLCLCSLVISLPLLNNKTTDLLLVGTATVWQLVNQTHNPSVFSPEPSIPGFSHSGDDLSASSIVLLGIVGNESGLLAWASFSSSRRAGSIGISFEGTAAGKSPCFLNELLFVPFSSKRRSMCDLRCTATTLHGLPHGWVLVDLSGMI